MVYVYAADIRNLEDPKEHPEVLEGLSEQRKEKIMRQKTAKGRVQSLGAGLLLKKVLEQHHKAEAQTYEDEKGKPLIEGLSFNLSHTEGIALCVVGEQAVGCDVERIKEAPAAVAKHFFTEQENHALEQLKGDAYNQEFFRFWTMRESYMKMTGEGLRVPFCQYEMRREDEGFVVYRDGKKDNCHLKEYEIPGYQVTICTKEEHCVEQIEFIDVGDR